MAEQVTRSPRDYLVWVIIVAIIGAGIWANYQYSYIDTALRLIGWLALALVVLGVSQLSSQGKAARQFAKAARTELRKVVWPTRQETVRMTGMVVIMIIIVSLIVWGIDAVFLHLVGYLVGQRG